MENILDEFWFDVFRSRGPIELQDYEPELQSDHSDYVVVDYEEGDFGIIRYTDTTGNLVAIFVNYGGDCEEYVFTNYGKRILMGIVQVAVSDIISGYLNRVSQ